MESFVEAMRRLDVDSIPCSVLDTGCISNPQSLALLHLRTNSDEHLFRTKFTERFTAVKSWLRVTGIRDKIYDRLSHSHRILLGLIMRHADRAVKGQLDFNVRRPYQFVRLKLQNATVDDQAKKLFLMERLRDVNLKKVKEERFTYILSTPPNPEFLGPFERSVNQCEGPDEWIDELIAKGRAPKEGLTEIRGRICSYIGEVRNFIKGAMTLEAALQPLLYYDGFVAFANPHLVRIYSRAIKLDRLEHLELLRHLPPVDVTFPVEKLYTAYEEYVMKARRRLSDLAWLQLCTGLADKQQVRMLAEIPLLLQSIETLTDCQLKSFGMDADMPLNQRISLIGSFLKEPFYGSWSQETEVSLLLLGRNEPAESLQNLRRDPKLLLQLRLLFRIKDVGGLIIKGYGSKETYLTILNGLAQSLTITTFHISSLSAETILNGIIRCHLLHDEEIRLYLQSVIEGKPMLGCTPPTLNLQHSVEYTGVGGSPEAYHSLFRLIVGIPLTIPASYSSMEARKRLSERSKTPRKNFEEMAVLAVITAGRLKFNRGNSIWNSPDSFEDYLKTLGEAICSKPVPFVLGPSLHLLWSRLVPERLQKITCDEYLSMIDLVNPGIHPSLDRDHLISNSLIPKIPHTVTLSPVLLEVRLKRYSKYYLELINKALDDPDADHELILQQPATDELLKVPLYGMVLKEMLRDEQGRNSYLYSSPKDFSQSSHHVLSSLLDEYFMKVPLRKRVFIIPEVVPGFRERLENNPMLDQLQQSNIADFLGKMVIYGLPVVQWMLNKDTFKDQLLFGLSPPENVDKDKLYNEAILEGAGKLWIDLFTDRDKLIRSTPELEEKTEL